MELTHKAFEVKELSEEGQLSAVISTFGQVDRDGDLMDAQAFVSQHGKSIPMVWAHDWNDPVGKGVVSADKEKATFTGQFFLDTARGMEAYKTVKAMGELQEYSIGFRVVEQEFRSLDVNGAKQAVRAFKDIELFEASPVLVGAAYGTHTVGIKSAEVTSADALATLKAATPTGLHQAIQALTEAHNDSCKDGDCPIRAQFDIALLSVNPERAKTLQEIAARAGQTQARS